MTGHDYPAIALLELDSIAVGIRTADAMVKRAPISVLKAGTVHPGRYLVLVGGSVASVDEAAVAGRSAAGEWLNDETVLPDVEPRLTAALLGRHTALERDALIVLETRSAPCLLAATDAALKATTVSLARVRIADDLGGRCIALFDGELADVEAAAEVVAERVPGEHLLHVALVPRLDSAVQSLLNGGTRFHAAAGVRPEGAEIDAHR